MRTPTVVVILSAIAMLVPLLVRSVEIPYTVALVVAGLGLGATHVLLIITMTFGVVLLSLLVNGLSIAPLLRLLGLAQRQTATS
jgi:hypothetical protein